jgi:hypothetical protein
MDNGTYNRQHINSWTPQAHLRQLATYIHERDREGWYYGPREQFERRHADLLKLADRIEAIANDEDARLPNAGGEA